MLKVARSGYSPCHSLSAVDGQPPREAAASRAQRYRWPMRISQGPQTQPRNEKSSPSSATPARTPRSGSIARSPPCGWRGGRSAGGRGAARRRPGRAGPHPGAPGRRRAAAAPPPDWPISYASALARLHATTTTTRPTPGRCRGGPARTSATRPRSSTLAGAPGGSMLTFWSGRSTSTERRPQWPTPTVPDSVVTSMPRRSAGRLCQLRGSCVGHCATIRRRPTRVSRRQPTDRPRTSSSTQPRYRCHRENIRICRV